MKSKYLFIVIGMIAMLAIGMGAGCLTSELFRKNAAENEVSNEFAYASTYVDRYNSTTNTVAEEDDEESEPETSFDTGMFKVDISTMEVGDVLEQLLNPNITIKIKALADEYGNKWTLIVNGVEAYTETSIADEIELHFTNSLIFYATQDGTDVRESKFIVIDTNGKIVKEIYEFDESNKGLVFTDAYYTNNAVILEGSRGWHGGSIVAPNYYQATPAEFSEEALEKVPADLTTSAIRIYKINSDGSVDFDHPQEMTTQTFKEYVNKYLEDSTDENELTVKMKNWLEEHK